MRKMILAFFILSICIQTAHSAIPTVEGLFRNGANADVAGDTIAISIMIEKTVTELKTEGEIVQSPVYAKVIFSRNENEPLRMIQVVYSKAQMDNMSAIDVVSSANIIDQIKKDSPVERKLFYSMLIMYGLNSSEGMNFVAQRVSPDFRSNKEIVNGEKKELYQRYMGYLRNRANTDQNLEESESPIKPRESDEQERVNEILSKKYLNETGAVVLARQKGVFFWEVRLENMIAKFTHADHRLRNLLLTTIDGPLQVSVGDFVMFNGVHELPKLMNWVFPNGDTYKITTISHQDFVSRGKTFAQRFQEYEKILENNRSRSEVTNSAIRNFFLY